MSAQAIVYLLFTLALSAVFAGIVIHTYARKRRDRVEAPKYRMLLDDPEPPSPEERG